MKCKQLLKIDTILTIICVNNELRNIYVVLDGSTLKAPTTSNVDSCNTDKLLAKILKKNKCRYVILIADTTITTEQPEQPKE